MKNLQLVNDDWNFCKNGGKSETKKVSVITPCHNMDGELMKKAFLSLKEQTYGFENIEWLIVFHNSPKTDIEKFRKIIKAAENIKIFSLNNNIHSPASPRNYALKHVTGEYIGFLDSDDAYASNTCEKAISELEITGAQIVSFRYEVLGIENARFPIKSAINIEGDSDHVIEQTSDWDSQKYGNGIALGLTTKFYKASFITKNKLCFNEKIPFASDTLFNIQCFDKLDTICFLPRFMGYQYYIKPKSIVQKVDEAETIIEYAEGIKLIFDAGLKSKLDINDLMWELTAYISTAVMFSKEVRKEDTCRIAGVLESYLQYMKPLQPSNVHPENTVEHTIKLVTSFLKYPEMFFESTRNNNVI